MKQDGTFYQHTVVISTGEIFETVGKWNFKGTYWNPLGHRVYFENIWIGFGAFGNIASNYKEPSSYSNTYLILTNFFGIKSMEGSQSMEGFFLKKIKNSEE